MELYVCRMTVDSKNNLLALAPLMIVVKLSASSVELDFSLIVSWCFKMKNWKEDLTGFSRVKIFCVYKNKTGI